MWEARAEYADGTVIERMFYSDPRANEDEEQYNIENWLLSAHDGCVFYSVNWVNVG